jgi:hypothetical protein
MAEQPHEAIRTRKPEAETTRPTEPERSDLTAGDRSPDERDAFTRAALDTPRRYDQPIEDDDDPVMPSPDATVNTKI